MTFVNKSGSYVFSMWQQKYPVILPILILVISVFLIIKYHDENHASVYNHSGVNFCGFDEKAFILKSSSMKKIYKARLKFNFPHCKVKKVDLSNVWQLSLIFCFFCSDKKCKDECYRKTFDNFYCHVEVVISHPTIHHCENF